MSVLCILFCFPPGGSSDAFVFLFLTFQAAKKTSRRCYFITIEHPPALLATRSTHLCRSLVAQRWREKNFGVRKITNFTELALLVMQKSPERKSSNFLLMDG